MSSTHLAILISGLGLLVAAACGGSTSSGGTSSTGGSGGVATGGSGGAPTGGSGGVPTGGSGGVDCSLVGCAPPPMCDTGCQEVCGCCMCGEGSTQPADGGYLLCVGGCYTFVAAKTCGGLAEAPCGPDEYCDFPASSYCGGDDSPGHCVKKPGACDASCPGVCGCDGKFYCNECMAQSAGTDGSQSTSCMGDGGVGTTCGSDGECAPGLKCCYPCGIPGCQNQCTQPGSDGQCIPVP